MRIVTFKIFFMIFIKHYQKIKNTSANVANVTKDSLTIKGAKPVIHVL